MLGQTQTAPTRTLQECCKTETNRTHSRCDSNFSLVHDRRYALLGDECLIASACDGLQRLQFQHFNTVRRFVAVATCSIASRATVSCTSKLARTCARPPSRTVSFTVPLPRSAVSVYSEPSVGQR